MKFRRMISVSLALAMLFLLTAGCGGGGSEGGGKSDGQSSETPASGEEITLTYWNLTATDMPFERDLIAQFERSHPGIKIELVQVPVENFHDKLVLAAQTNTLPDVAQGIPEWSADMVEAGALADITADIKDVQDIYGSALGLCGWEGDYYGLPFRFGTSGIFVNTDIAQAAGVTIPERWTWEEFSQIAQKLTNSGAGVYGFGIPGSNGDLGLSWNYLTLALNNGGSFLKDGKAAFNTPESAQALDNLRGMMEKGILPESTVSFTASDVVDAFGAGKVAMFMNGPWYIATVKSSYPDLKFTTVALPTMNEQAEAFSVNGGTYLSVCSSTQYYEQALEFIKYMTSEDIMRQWAGQGEFLPAVSSLMEEDNFSSGLIGPFAYQATLPSVTIAATPENTHLMEILQTEVAYALLGTKTSEQALNDAAAQWNEILASYQS